MLNKLAVEVLHQYLAQGNLAPVDSIALIGHTDSDEDYAQLNNVADNVVRYVASAVVADFDSLRSQRWSLAVVISPEIGKVALVKLLARLRDLHSKRVLHIETADCWSVKDSLALGFAAVDLQALQVDVAADGDFCEMQAYEFDLHSYKKAPDWLNARHWANPERWDKFRW